MLGSKWLKDSMNEKGVRNALAIGKKIEERKWEEMPACLDIRKEQLPEIKECGIYLGNVCKGAAKSTGLSEDTKAVTGALDQTCGAIGAGKIFIPEEKNAPVYDAAFADYVNLYEALVPMFR